MKANRLVRVSFSTVSMLICAAVISSCGASKEAKKSPQTTAEVVDSTGNTNTNPQPTVTASTPSPGAPLGKEKEDKEVVDATPALGAPIGRVDSDKKEETSDDKKTEQDKNVEFNETEALKTGGQIGDLSYTSNGDDGVMELFRATAKTVGQAQQEQNAKLAKAINGARLRKNGSDYNLDLAIIEEGDQAKIYKMKATVEGSRMGLSLISATGDLEFQGGFVKCLDASCDNAYAKIKISGAYTRVIFRTMKMNNHFMIEENGQDENFNTWKTYILNTVQGVPGVARIHSVKASSYEILNGKAAMGVQLTTQDNEALVLNTLLVAPETGTELNQKITKVSDLSMNYNLEPTTGKLKNLSNKISDTSLVNNTGKGKVKIKLAFSSGAISMVLTKEKSKLMSAAEIQAFEKTVPNF